MTYEVMKARVGAIKKLERVLMRSLSAVEKNYVTENGIVQFLNDYLKIPLERWELMLEIQSYIAAYFTANAVPEASSVVLEELKKILAKSHDDKSTTSVKIGDPENLGTKIRYPEDTNQCSDEDLIQGCQFDSDGKAADSTEECQKQDKQVTSSLEDASPLYTKALNLIDGLPDCKGVGLLIDNDNVEIVLLK